VTNWPTPTRRTHRSRKATVAGTIVALGQLADAAIRLPRMDLADRAAEAANVGPDEFEVTSPRVTCFNVGMSVEEPCMPALYAHGQPAFYAVLEEGEVSAGDEIERIAVGPEAIACGTSAPCSTCREASTIPPADRFCSAAHAREGP